MYSERKENAFKCQEVPEEQEKLDNGITLEGKKIRWSLRSRRRAWCHSGRKENTDTLEEVTEEEHGEVDNDIWELKKPLMILGPHKTIKRWQHWRIRWQRYY